MHISINIRGEELWLLPQKGLFWPKEKVLVIADLHFGKTTHFRKNGVAMLSEMPFLELENLNLVVKQYAPEQIIFLGDLFHSELNSEWGLFEDWMNHLSAQLILVNGNHDRHLLDKADLKNLESLEEYKMGPFIFTHEPLEVESELYNIYGHIHPGVRLRGKGRQSLRLPAYCFGEKSAILPAFGLTTGLMTQKPNKKTRYFVIGDNEVFEVKP